MFPLDNPFWQFSLQRYALPGVADICLQLQQEASMDINILLWCLWLEEQGHQLDDSDWFAGQRMIAATNSDLIYPLRALRRTLPQQEPSYRACLAIELSAEQRAQAELYQYYLQHTSQKTDEAAAIKISAERSPNNLAVCERCAKVQFTAEQCRRLRSRS